MTKLFLVAGVAALFIAAPAAAEQGKGGDKGQKGHSAKVERGGKKGSFAKVERRAGGERVFVQRHKGGNTKAERREFKADREVFKAKHQRRRELRADRDYRNFVRVRDGDDDWNDRGRTIYAGACPPGHSKHVPAGLCMPYGQFKNSLRGQLLPAAYRDRMLPIRLRNIYRDDDNYFYRLGDGGNLYRVDRRTSVISALLPLLGGGLSTGQLFPSAYSNYMVPSQYRAFYQDSSDDYYRFANGYVYEVDRDSGLIENMIPLLAGGYGVGQMLPASYSAYNVPYQYRSLYADNNDYMYRYAPGAIYQVDPTTSLITGIASLLTGGGLSIGQRLPMGYSTYNVPLAYRDQYYDTNDAWYRYNNGNIYQIDPTTQLVTALIKAIV